LKLESAIKACPPKSLCARSGIITAAGFKRDPTRCGLARAGLRTRYRRPMLNDASRCAGHTVRLRTLWARRSSPGGFFQRADVFHLPSASSWLRLTVINGRTTAIRESYDQIARNTPAGFIASLRASHSTANFSTDSRKRSKDMARKASPNWHRTQVMSWFLQTADTLFAHWQSEFWLCNPSRLFSHLVLRTRTCSCSLRPWAWPLRVFGPSNRRKQKRDVPDLKTRKNCIYSPNESRLTAKAFIDGFRLETLWLAKKT